MKWLIFTLSLSLGGLALAADKCDSECAEVIKQCSDTCGKALKKDGADKVNFCKSKCKEFENECKKDCKADPKK